MLLKGLAWRFAALQVFGVPGEDARPCAPHWQPTRNSRESVLTGSTLSRLRPPCGGGLGRGSGVLAKLLPNLTTPTPNPSPQGHKGGEDGVRCSFCAFRRDPAIRRCQSSAKFPTKPALTASLPMPNTIRNGRCYALAQGPARGDVASSRGLDGRSTMGGDAT